MGLLIKNGEIVTADARYRADIWCEGETITEIAPHIDAPPGAEVIDATGKLVFPGFIDPHTHIYLPFMGTYAKDTYESASIAALCGGTTTFFDFAIPGKGETPKDAYAIWKSKSEGLSACDYSFHFVVTQFDENVRRDIAEIVQEGFPSFKVFLAYKNALDISDESLFQALTFAKENGVVVSAHCENAEIVAQRQDALVKAGHLGPEYHEPSRPRWVEADGTRHFMTMAKATGTEVYIVHLSCRAALEEAIKAKLDGVKVHVETLASYLMLDKSYAELPNFEGAKYVMSPPLRDKEEQEVLWSALNQGIIETVGTDHAPFDTTQKAMGKQNFCLIPNGIPAIEDRVRLLYTYGVATGRLDIHRFVDALSTRPAKIFGLFPRKGTIQLGADADFAIYDPSVDDVATVKKQHMNVDYNAFEGMKLKGRFAAVTVRGKVQVRDGEFVGEKGIGKLLRRKPRV